MTEKATKSSMPSTSTNKDLSCLRCRKKKAKCSKTRPQCTRCARSNQPCEYPEAPPNLTDLSQKVLTLYDTLRELEGEFLVKYMQSLSKDMDDDERDESIETSPEFNVTTQPDTIELNKAKTIKQEPTHDEEDISTQEPGGWSMSLTPSGLSIHAVTRNLSEFHEFTKSISSQIMRDFGPKYLPKNWDPDAEGYFENSDIDDDLDEDDYLVTVPVISTKTLFHTIEATPQKIEGSHTHIPSHYPNMIKHLHLRYQWLEQDEPHAGSSHHLVILMHQLKLYLPDYAPHSTTDMTDALSQICILTAYVISVTLLPPIPDDNVPPLPESLLHDYATSLLVDLVLSKGDQIPCYPIILCSILLAWLDTEMNLTETKADAMIHIALSVLCGSNWQSEEPAWQILIAALLYLDVYSATFGCKKPQLRSQEELWKAAVQMREPSRWHASYQEAGIVLEARLMSLLNKVITLFYQDTDVHVRKIDVDEVLTLVRDIELWEQELPEWAKWNYELTQEEMPRLGLKMHMHMIHNMVKILLFRPLCSNEEQTYTMTIFLDMSTSSADRLTKCLLHIHEYGFTGFWKTAASNLVRDVSTRVMNMFNSDESIVNQLNVIETRLEKAESIKL